VQIIAVGARRPWKRDGVGAVEEGPRRRPAAANPGRGGTEMLATFARRRSLLCSAAAPWQPLLPPLAFSASLVFASSLLRFGSGGLRDGERKAPSSGVRRRSERRSGAWKRARGDHRSRRHGRQGRGQAGSGMFFKKPPQTDRDS
jgi:hypothetical protein